MPIGRTLALGLVLAAGVARAADEPACRTFDRTKACCRHAPPQCCTPDVRAPLEDADVAQICGAPTAKGQSGQLNECKRYYERGELAVEMAFGREPGDASAFEQLRVDLAGPRARVDKAVVAGAQRGFLRREVDETGQATRIGAWALVGAEIVHVEAERPLCDEGQVLRLLARAIERLRAPRPATARRPG